MRKTIIFLSSILLIFMLAGCSSSSKMSGKYYNASNSNKYVELMSDGTFFVKDGSSYSGKYVVKSNELILTLGDGDSEKLQINGNTLIDDEGEKWVKK